MDTGKLNQLMEGMIQTPAAYQRYFIQSLGRDYSGDERYQAAYLMTEVNIGDYVTVLPGVRWEKDYSLYHGQRYRAVVTGGNTQRPPLDFTPVSAERDNQFWLPMAHVTVKPLDWFKVRLAFTKTLTRPDYRQYAPITFIDANQTSIVAANYDLKPALSKNYDVAMSVFDNSVGLITVSGFYKEISDLIFFSSYALAPGVGPPPGSNIPPEWIQGVYPAIYSYPANNPTSAYIRGVELEWQTHFWYLPSILQGLVLNVNYTRIGSNVDIHWTANRKIVKTRIPPIFTYQAYDTSRTSRVPGQPSSLLNLTLGYDFEGFSTRLSYLYQSDRVSGINLTNPALDSFTSTYERWDLSVQQSITEWGIQLFANFSNLNARPDESLLDFKFYHPSSIEYYGFTMDVGVRFKL
jgi:TonB-dependent receptor